jgi:hypothetical protein
MRPPAGTIPLGDLARLAPLTRRTWVLRALLALLAVAAAAAAVVVAARAPESETALLPQGSDGLVVLDLSASISSDTYARIGATIEQVAASDGRYGLVVFSDTAYLALPPGSPARELRPFGRYFRLPGAGGGVIRLPTSPWTEAFSAGTRISAGLQLALDIIREERLAQPAVLLVSDLDDDIGDLDRMTTAALALRRAGARIRVVGLNPAPEDERYVERLLRRPGDLVQARLPGERREEGGRGLSVSLVLVALAAALALGLRELLVPRLRWEHA